MYVWHSTITFLTAYDSFEVDEYVDPRLRMFRRYVASYDSIASKNVISDDWGTI